MATNFGTKIAINAYKCISMGDSENVITYNRVFVVDQSKEDTSGCKGLRGVAMATKFWPKSVSYTHLTLPTILRV